MTGEPIFFATPDDLRAWFAANVETATELWVGYHRKATGVRSVTWPESVDEALCVGWIDGIRKSLDGERYMIRFTPRKARSTWSAVNIRRMAELIADGRVRPAGLAAFERRSDDRSAIYAYEQRHGAAFTPEEQAAIDGDQVASAFWAAQPAGYRRTATYWVASAKRPETRSRRFEALLADCAEGRRVAAIVPPGRRGT